MESSQEWYKSLLKPNWAPEPQVFGQVWSVLYPIIFGVNVYVIYLLINNRITWMVALPFWLNLFFNLVFTPLQFGLRSNLLALIDLVFIIITLIWAMAAIWPISKISTVLFIPYLIWVIIAGILQLSITMKN